MTTSERVPHGGRLWPTPSANLFECDPAIWMPRRERERAKHRNGNGFGLTLAMAVQADGMVEPEPASADEPLTLFAADSLASPSPSPGKGSRRRIAGGSGPQPVTSFATWDPDGCCWKTFQGCLDGEWETYSATWPRSGMTRNGIAYRRASSVPPIYANGSSSWPTPKSQDAKHGAATEYELAHSDKWAPYHLHVAIAARERDLWPTPKGSAANYGRPLADDRGDLQAAVSQWPTPTSSRWSGLQSHGQNALLGQLNPRWVELLMGYPPGWTELDD